MIALRKSVERGLSGTQISPKRRTFKGRGEVAQLVRAQDS